MGIFVNDLYAAFHFREMQQIVMENWNMVSARLQDNTFFAITFDYKSNCTCLEKSMIFSSIEVYRRYPDNTCVPGMCCWENSLEMIGMSIVKKNCHLHGQTTQDKFIEGNEDTLSAGGYQKKTPQLLVQMIYGQKCGSVCLMQRKESTTKLRLRETKDCQATQLRGRSIRHRTR